MIPSLRRLRRILAPALLACYGLPGAVAFVADAVHAAQHVGAAAVAGHRRAVALGLVHTPAEVRAQDPVGATDGKGPVVVGFVHTHGGTTHAHGNRVAALLQATDSESSAPTPAPPPSVAPHVAAIRATTVARPLVPVPNLDRPLDAGLPPAFAPATPPPRA